MFVCVRERERARKCVWRSRGEEVKHILHHGGGERAREREREHLKHWSTSARAEKKLSTSCTTSFPKYTATARMI